jgi:hypothetical protein
MPIPTDRLLPLVFPSPEWKAAIQRLADRNGLSMSAFICARLSPLVEKERRDAEGGEPIGA